MSWSAFPENRLVDFASSISVVYNTSLNKNMLYCGGFFNETGTGKKISRNIFHMTL